MTDIRPILEVEGTLLRKYYSKKLGKLMISKDPIIYVRSHADDCCRETLGHGIKDDMWYKMYNSKTKDYTYKLEPLLTRKVKDKMVYGSSHIGLSTNSITIGDVFYHDDSLVENTLEIMNLILGTMGVCLSDRRLESTWRNSRTKTSKSKYCNRYSHSKFGVHISYDVLSPFWLVSPVMQSIVVGIARNCMSLAYDKHYDKLFSSITKLEVSKIIDNTNSDEAYKVFKEITLPFYKKYEPTWHILSNTHYQRVIAKLVKDGCFTYFNPNNTTNYWQNFDDHYGLEDFTSEVGTSLKVDWKKWGTYG